MEPYLELWMVLPSKKLNKTRDNTRFDHLINWRTALCSSKLQNNHQISLLHTYSILKEELNGEPTYR